jgi:hypothetical protein
MFLPFGGNLSVCNSIDSKTAKVFVGHNDAVPILIKDVGWSTWRTTTATKGCGHWHDNIKIHQSQAWTDQRDHFRHSSTNNLRHADERYADQEAEIKIYGGPDKQPLTLDKSPILIF